MAIYRARFVLAVAIGVGMITVVPGAMYGQERGNAQSQDQHPQGEQHAPAQRHQAQKPQQSRPAQGHTARPTSHPATSRPAATRPQSSHNTHATPAANRPANNRPANNRPTSHARPAPGRTQQSRASRSQGRANYQFRSQDTSRLRQYYQGNFSRIDRAHRPHFGRGGYIPMMYRGYFQPVPVSLIGYLPAVPPGYAIGYYDGYVVVYDPTTYLIVAVLDILQ